MTDTKANRPGGETEAITESSAGGPNTPILVDPEAEATKRAGDHFRNCYAVLVQGKTIRRHLYFNLPAADKAVKRAHVRGDQAALILVRLVPVDARQLDQLNEAGAEE